MRYLLIIVAALTLSASSVHAQRYLPGQRDIEITGGVADGFKFDKEDGQAFYGNVSLSTYNKKGNRWVFGGEYFQRQYGYGDELIPVAQMTTEGGHYFQLLSDPGKTFFFSIGPSALAGYETLNWGEHTLSDGARLTGTDGFIYGGALSIELETFLTDRIVLLIRARERVMFGSSINRFHFQLGAGFKFIIN